MTRIIITPEIRAQLGDLKGPVELCDGDGRVVARLMPTEDVTTYVGLEPRISEEERQQRGNYNGPMKTTAEVLKRLEGL